MKKITAIFLGFILLLGTAAHAAAPISSDDTATYLLKTVTNPMVASVGGEWTVIGLARSGFEVDNRYFESYYENVLSYVKLKDGVLHSRKYTEYSRVVLALSAIGRDSQNVAGYNLVTPLLDYEKTIWQGINGAIWALIALDSGNYGSRDIKEKYIARILECEKENGGWSLSETEQNAEADITAMALIALSKYQSSPAVQSAIERAISVLSSMQNEDGGYSAYHIDSSESAAQVLTALSALGISYNDTRFIKNGKTLLDNLYSFKQKDGSFSHTNEANLMATEQCFYALVSAQRLLEGKSALFDMSDVKKASVVQNGLSGRHEDINIPEIKFINKTFSDIEGHKNREAIEELAKRGMINGMDKTVFAPEKTMTRAEFAAMIVRAFGLPLKRDSVFDDVALSAWYADYVNAACHYGIVNGISETIFHPTGTITVEQAMTMLCRVADLCGMDHQPDAVAARNVLAEFADYMTISDWAKSSVAFCFETGIAERSVVEIQPTESVKRCQVADMLYNLLKGAMLI